MSSGGADMQHEAAKPKGEARSEDAPRQEPMRGSASIIRRNPSTDQKKVRRQMAKKADFDDLFSMSKISVKTNCIDCNETMIAPEDNFFPECPNCRDRKRRDVAADQDKSFFDQTKASRKTAGIMDPVECTQCGWSGNALLGHDPDNDSCPMGCGKTVILKSNKEASRKIAENENPLGPNRNRWGQWVDGKGNANAADGIDRCGCGSKNWGNDRCRGCNKKWDVSTTWNNRTLSSLKTAGLAHYPADVNDAFDHLTKVHGQDPGEVLNEIYEHGYDTGINDVYPNKPSDNSPGDALKAHHSGLHSIIDGGYDEHFHHDEENPVLEVDHSLGGYDDGDQYNSEFKPQSSRKTAAPLLALLPELLGGAEIGAAAGGAAEVAGAGAAGAGAAGAGEAAAGTAENGIGSFLKDQGKQMLKDQGKQMMNPNQQQQKSDQNDSSSAIGHPLQLQPEASSKFATQYETSADRLNPGDEVRLPTGQTVKVKRVRNHESSGKHVYVDTEGGTTVVPRNESFQIVPQNARQQELPGYGVPGGTSNKLPFDPHGPGGTNVAPDSVCPVCGSKGTLRRTGDHYTCSKCGYQENFGGASDKNYSSSTQVIRTFTQKNNRHTASAIAKRAQEVLDLEENQ